MVVVGYESEKVSDYCGRPARPWVYGSRPSFRMMIIEYKHGQEFVMCSASGARTAQTGFLVDGDLQGDGAFDAVARFPGTCAAVSDLHR